ncbi:hypothetical protein N6H18_17455 [Reichenbachiella agarivorans]|uniref:Uncharacterized protein n=1 Tax=Reichenbachiella agarivorans TaxID=2979464 RepID=A0ABY6CNN1_9BACT|nr:hypothetical protein [Reichenbachiella agarivorans]UXP32132.1 hypothetical protein N6H18_17455 [Reichenbachiella agarivorans]
MKFIIRLLLIAIFSYLLSLVMPWWILILVAGILSFILPGGNFNAILSGLLGGGLLWMVMAWKVDVETNSIMSTKIIQLFPIDDVNMIIIATGVLGGIAGALGAFTGNSFRQIFIKKKEKSFYS